jgi:hypothetical protein
MPSRPTLERSSISASILEGLRRARGMPLFEDSWKRLKRSKVHAEAFQDELVRLFPQAFNYPQVELF